MENVENFFTIQDFPEKFSTFHKKIVENVENTFCAIEIVTFSRFQICNFLRSFPDFSILWFLQLFYPF